MNIIIDQFFCQVTSYLGMEDDILVNLVMAELEKENEPDPRRIQINLTGFLDRNAPSFVAELWKLLISAQENYLPGQKGIPTELLKEKIIEIDKLNKVIEFRQKNPLGMLNVWYETNWPRTGITPSCTKNRGRQRAKGEGHHRLFQI
jgi:hypothetical protein